MAWPAATTLTSLLVLLITLAACSSSRIIVTTQAPFGRILKAVKLHGGYMEVIQEQRCSHGLLRLTCRSLKAFIFILQAEYHANHTELCLKEKNLEELRMWEHKGSTRRWIDMRELKGNYILDDEDNKADVVDIRSSLNKRCSGQKHCRYNATIDQPGAHSWIPGEILLKYACIPAAVKRYCNQEVKVTIGEGGYINTPGYPLYYLGQSACGWTFRTFPGQRIVLIFHDLNIRGPQMDGSCVDIVRVRDRGSTLFEFCGTAAGTRIVSNSNVLTLDFVASRRLYSARGFLLQYQALGCPEILAPNGSYVSNGTLTSRTFSCKSGSVFPDSKERKRTLECKNGKWNETTTKLPACVATSAVILKTENDHHHLSSLSGDNIFGTGVRIGRGEDAVASGSNNPVMDSAQSAMMKQADYVVDFVLPTVLIALLFVGNAVIVYIIFQFRKRRLPATIQGEEVALRGPADVPQV
ncbi:uncharacterized protein LOC105255023 isoform X2 [Camponotus floridanus]|uniref:uncharacterized protein LOC105255023 isoform X2 n=1 Tax=Camponotus floridanus TaxID=104421 RepID=UPI00059E90A7|nr:uncharacterized protein LOC105255023 isoform X2 [Camponotus floridanus]